LKYREIFEKQKKVIPVIIKYFPEFSIIAFTD